MDARLKAKWVAALRSGKYKQARGSLVGVNGKHLCCIGVGYVVAHPKTKVSVLKNLPTPMAGELIGIGMYKHELVVMNDGKGQSFKQIAKWIEKNIPVSDHQR